MLLSLALTLTLSGAGDTSHRPRYFTRDCQRTPGGRSTRGVPCAPSYAFFELAPASGAGLGSACACAAVTGAGGETATFARSSSAYCTKEGFATTSLTTSSMALCGTNTLRVEAGGDGKLGLLFEETRTNSALRSEELDNAAWSAASITTRTADTDVAPNGATTAERLVLSGGATSSIYQSVSGTGSATTWTLSVYLKSRSGTPQVYCYAFEGSGTPSAYTAVTLTTSSWTRCVLTIVKTTIQALTFGIGYDTTIGTANSGTADFAVWGAQAELGPFATSYIATTSASATRAFDGNFFFTLALAGANATGSAAVTITPAAATTIVAGDLIVGNSAGRPLYANNTIRMYDQTTEPIIANGFVANVPKRYWSSWTGSTQSLNNATDAVNATGSFDGTMMGASTGIYVGSGAIIGNSGDWIISRVCLDPSPLRCR